MYAKAQAEVAPTSSNTVPRSQVMSDIAMAVTTSDVVNIRCKFILNGSLGNQ